MNDTVRVELGQRAYDVFIGAGLLARTGELIAPFATSRRVFIVTDENVARLHLAALTRAIGEADLAYAVVTMPPGEASKSFAGLERVCGELLRANIARRDLVIAFGGGVIGDLAGLAAGLVKRGVDFVQIPTTLLSQVDSSVGGKTAIDTPEGKNLVGLIHQPRLVIADLGVLSTLPRRELMAGYAEIFKAGLIGDADLFGWCEANFSSVLACEPSALAAAVSAAVAFKARIVEADEREEGPRMLLNLGHTFAHALEAHSGYDGALLHGEAVAVGIGLAFELSARLELCSEADARRVRAHIAKAGYATDLRAAPGAPFDVERLIALMAADKKAEAGALTLILARGPGKAFVQKAASVDAVRALLLDETQ